MPEKFRKVCQVAGTNVSLFIDSKKRGEGYGIRERERFLQVLWAGMYVTKPNHVW